MLLVDFKRSKRMGYFHGSENESMFTDEVLSAILFVPPKVLTRRNVFPGDGCTPAKISACNYLYSVPAQLRNFFWKGPRPNKILTCDSGLHD